MIDLPDEYPDETVYSLAARYADRYKFPSYKTTLNSLFGVSHIGSLTTFPSQLQYLTNALPENKELTIQKLMLRHSLLPYHAPFISKHQLTEMMQYMKGNENGNQRPKMPFSGPKKLPDWLRYCPICTNEDRLEYGETYWHRLHQVYDIHVCSLHEVFLENSSVPFTLRPGRKNKYELISADKSVKDFTPRDLNLSNRTHRLLLRLTKDAQWLLSTNSLESYKLEIFSKHRQEIKLQFNRNTKVNMVKDVIDSFNKFFPNDFLDYLDLPNIVEKMGWIEETITKGILSEPVKHLLLIYLWGYTNGEEFLQSAKNQNHFYPPPWPCLNPFCRHYREKTISKEQMLIQFINGYPIGIFSCNCGFIYKRRGPDISENDIFHMDSIVEEGNLWENNFKKLYKDSNLSLGELRQLLNHSSSRAQLPLQAIKLGVSDERKPIKSIQIREFLSEFSSYEGDDMKQAYRSAWLGLCEEYPKAVKKTLRFRGRQIYTWLKENDTEWLQNNEPQTPEYFPPVMDWKDQDDSFASYIKDFAQKEVNTIKHPRQITYAMLSTEIELALNIKMPARKTVMKMPLSKAAIEEVTESYEKYGARRIFWHSEKLLSRNQIYTQSDLISFAGVSKKYRESKLVINALNIAMERLHDQTHGENP